MDYQEHPAPAGLTHLISAVWTLTIAEVAGGWCTHVATPDGCMEIIRRSAGRSIWGGEQPHLFVAGLLTRPAELQLSSGSRFLGLRIWPWAWHAIAEVPCAALVDQWRRLEPAELKRAVDLGDSADNSLSALPSDLLGPAEEEVARAVLASTTPAEMARKSGRDPRWLQRWFARNVGVSPSTYFRLVRFNHAFTALETSTASLAAHAADHRFADQSHMAREFRRLAGQGAASARPRVTGPFLNSERKRPSD